jgi:hypothetical protein
MAPSRGGLLLLLCSPALISAFLLAPRVVPPPRSAHAATAAGDLQPGHSETNLLVLFKGGKDGTSGADSLTSLRQGEFQALAALYGVPEVTFREALKTNIGLAAGGDREPQEGDEDEALMSLQHVDGRISREVATLVGQRAIM